MPQQWLCERQMFLSQVSTGYPLIGDVVSNALLLVAEQLMQGVGWYAHVLCVRLSCSGQGIKECGAWCECWNCHNTPVEAEDDEVGGTDADSQTESDSENDSSESESESESEDSCGEMEM